MLYNVMEDPEMISSGPDIENYFKHEMRINFTSFKIDGIFFPPQSSAKINGLKMTTLHIGDVSIERMRTKWGKLDVL